MATGVDAAVIAEEPLYVEAASNICVGLGP